MKISNKFRTIILAGLASGLICTGVAMGQDCDFLADPLCIESNYGQEFVQPLSYGAGVSATMQNSDSLRKGVLGQNTPLQGGETGVHAGQGIWIPRNADTVQAQQ